MSFYKCGHEGEPMFLRDNVFSLIHYYQWKDSVGYDGNKTMCHECWAREWRAEHPLSKEDTEGEV